MAFYFDTITWYPIAKKLSFAGISNSNIEVVKNSPLNTKFSKIEQRDGVFIKCEGEKKNAEHEWVYREIYYDQNGKLIFLGDETYVKRTNYSLVQDSLSKPVINKIYGYACKGIDDYKKVRDRSFKVQKKYNFKYKGTYYKEVLMGLHEREMTINIPDEFKVAEVKGV